MSNTPLSDAESDELLDRLTRLAAVHDPVPQAVVDAAIASENWRDIDAELAELVFDSAVDGAMVGARGVLDGRQLTFEAPGMTVELEVLGEPARIQGQLVPAGEADVEILHPRGSVSVHADPLGHFRADGVPEGPVSLRCRVEGSEAPVTSTDWVVR